MPVWSNWNDMDYARPEDYERHTLLLLEDMSMTLMEVAQEIKKGIDANSLTNRDRLCVLAEELEQNRQGLLLMAGLSHVQVPSRTVSN